MQSHAVVAIIVSVRGLLRMLLQDCCRSKLLCVAWTGVRTVQPLCCLGDFNASHGPESQGSNNTPDPIDEEWKVRHIPCRRKIEPKA